MTSLGSLVAAAAKSAKSRVLTNRRDRRTFQKRSLNLPRKTKSTACQQRHSRHQNRRSVFWTYTIVAIDDTAKEEDLAVTFYYQTSINYIAIQDPQPSSPLSILCGGTERRLGLQGRVTFDGQNMLLASCLVSDDHICGLIY